MLCRHTCNEFLPRELWNLSSFCIGKGYTSPPSLAWLSGRGNFRDTPSQTSERQTSKSKNERKKKKKKKCWLNITTRDAASKKWEGDNTEQTRLVQALFWEAGTTSAPFGGVGSCPPVSPAAPLSCGPPDRGDGSNPPESATHHPIRLLSS